MAPTCGVCDVLCHHVPYAFDACANAQSRDDAIHGQQRVLCNALNDEHDHLRDVLSCDAHGAYAHGDAHVHVDEQVLSDVIS